ncbi:hypothetical protein HG530_001703 [Fusarium avenaceum]|nr:hypothetical protein HG530_001703 [Fusarium avenaceum]
MRPTKQVRVGELGQFSTSLLTTTVRNPLVKNTSIDESFDTRRRSRVDPAVLPDSIPWLLDPAYGQSKRVEGPNALSFIGE